jgi:hypothetical protein
MSGKRIATRRAIRFFMYACLLFNKLQYLQFLTLLF